jgi:hypothetical protein
MFALINGIKALGLQQYPCCIANRQEAGAPHWGPAIVLNNGIMLLDLG